MVVYHLICLIIYYTYIQSSETGREGDGLMLSETASYIVEAQRTIILVIKRKCARLYAAPLFSERTQ
jgi:hypothetical protein